MKIHPFVLTGIMIVLGIGSRLLPHTWNITPLVAILLFISTYAGFRYSVTALFATLVVSDLFIGFYSTPIMFSVYGSFMVASVLGMYIRKQKSPIRIVGGAALSSLIFFLITNWAVWQFGTMYDPSWNGLITSYMMGLPFFKNSFIGDVGYTVLFFGIYEYGTLFIRSRKNVQTLPYSITK